MSIIIDSMGQLPRSFAHAFGDAFASFLHQKALTLTDAADRLGLGRKGVSRISSYCHDSPKGGRPTPSAELLYQICSTLEFEFEYNGCRITAAAMKMNGSKPRPPSLGQQLSLPFDRQFNLTGEQGTISVSVKRPPGRVEISMTIRANA
jgi:hypothetical protein